MKNILYLQSSIQGESGVSSEIAESLLSQLADKFPLSHIERIDLAENPLPHLDQKEFLSWTKDSSQRTENETKLTEISDGLIEQLNRQDILVIAVPMYNLGIPSVLKAWIDRIVRAGKTFRYTENGPVGMVGSVKVHLIMTRGGRYKDTPLDTQTDYLKNILGLIGITDIETIYAEGLAMGDDIKNEALNSVHQQISSSIAQAA